MKTRIGSATQRHVRRLLRPIFAGIGIGSLHQDEPTVQLRRLNDAILLEQIKKVGDQFFFVQIGANDGVSFDTLYQHVTEHRCSGLVIEPVQDYFDELKVNYADQPGITPLRVAIHATAGEIEIHRVQPSAEGYEHGRKGVASLDAEHHKKSGTKSSDIVSEQVPCISWSQLLRDNAVDRIDYLQIDIEGYDFEILKLVVADMPKCKPTVIKFEHCLRFDVMSPSQFGEATRMLTEAGYLLVMGPDDAIASLELGRSQG